jgi:N6-L-threonylcarbamoyladenine synthase
MMGLPYPGGPHVEKEAAQCKDPEKARHRFPLPRPLMGRRGCDFSFSGLKTAVRQTIADHGPLSPLDRIDLCFSLQETIGDILADRLSHALPYADNVHAKHFVLAGGVAANTFLRQRLASVAAEGGMDLVAPPLSLCTDNGAMIAWAGAERFKKGFISNLNTAARPRWPLSEMREVS